MLSKIARTTLCKHLLSLNKEWVPIHRWRRYSTHTNKGQFENLNPFGRLYLHNVKHKCINFKVTSLNPQEYPSQDKAFVSIDCGQHDTAENSVLECKLTDNTLEVYGDNTSSTQQMECLIQVPIKFDLNVQLRHQNSICVTNFENTDISIQVQHGECLLCNIKSGNIQVQTETGSVRSEDLVQGNVFIQTESGHIDLHKPIGQTLTVHTNTGGVVVKNLYAKTSNIQTQESNVHIGSCHGQVEVGIKQGNLNIGSVDGCLRADVKNGHTDVMVSQHEWVNVTTGKGDIMLKLSESLTSTLEISGNKLTFDKTINLENCKQEEKPNGQTVITGFVAGQSNNNQQLKDIGHITVDTSDGNVFTKCQTWLDSLNLGNKIQT